MSHRPSLLQAAALALALAAPAFAAAPAKPPPRLAGVWEMQGYRGSVAFTARQRIGTGIDGAGPPLQPWAAALLEKRVREADEEGRIFANNASRCLPQGFPYMLFAAVDGPVQIIESDDQVTLLSTEMAEHWLVYLNVRHPADVDPSFHGDSVGHWEGDTLVVDTVGLAGDKTTLDQVGTPHSDELHVVTRLRRNGPDELEIRVRMEDPKTFTRPFERRVVYRRAAPGVRLEEYVCENQANPPDAQGYQGFRSPFGGR